MAVAFLPSHDARANGADAVAACDRVVLGYQPVSAPLTGQIWTGRTLRPVTLDPQPGQCRTKVLDNGFAMSLLSFAFRILAGSSRKSRPRGDFDGSEGSRAVSRCHACNLAVFRRALACLTRFARRMPISGKTRRTKPPMANGLS